MITFEGLSFSYGNMNEEQLKSLNLQIERGEFVLLCGRSACGKTTATKCINGLIPHFSEGKYSGAVFVKGKDVANTPIYKISEDVGSVFQNPKTQFFNLDSNSELVFGMENLGVPPEKINVRMKEVTHDLGIENLLGNKMKLTYTNVNGYLIPNLTYKSGEQMEQLGKYGFLRRDYLKNHRNSTYQVMLLQDTIGEHLLEVDKAAREREEVILKQLEEKEPLPDKEKDQMAWVRAANQHRAIAEEIILKELIYV